MRKLIAIVALAACLSGCDNGASTPDSVQGTWGADCSKPFIKIEGGKIHVYPDDADYTLKTATFDGTHLVLGYDTAEGAATETYVFAKDTLRLDRGHYTGMDATWHKQQMQKC